MSKVTTYISDWSQRKTNLRCQEICAGLVHLGFKVRDGRRGGHKIVSHPELTSFFGTNFDCGHGTNAQVKPRYVEKIVGILSEWTDELERL